MMIWEKNSNQNNMAGGVERGGLEVVREMVNEYPRRGLPGR